MKINFKLFGGLFNRLSKGKSIQKLEQQYMKEVVDCSSKTGTETLRCISRKGKPISFKTENKDSCIFVDFSDGKKSIFGQKFDSLRQNVKLYNVRTVHSHPIDVPLSTDDVLCFLKMRQKRAIASGPNTFSSIEKESGLNAKLYRFIHKKRIYKEAEALDETAFKMSENMEKAFDEVKILTGNSNYKMSKESVKIWKDYSDFMVEELSKFAQKNHYKFCHNF